MAFGVSKKGIVLLPCKVTVESPYTTKEWAKIERLTSAKGKTYRSVKAVKRHIEAL